MAVVNSVVATGRPMNGADGLTLCSQSLRGDRLLLGSSLLWVGVGRPPIVRYTGGFLGAPFPQSELRQINLSLTGLHRLDNNAIGRRGSTGKLRRSSDRRRAFWVRFCAQR